ncbi:hypothetical protein MM_2543 [Methanosarcina mazei Go1]|uniref:Uncharacterized protein n=1 Tax=Methanosarcina mazei (strain ATCC BAA-159 / DSM 3647 / Goe1 / Go1 / JCM 11833 / OCM 88) TaxID=192952 RepID=Q8PU14_METMA|nr:hypothetical protein MM_2543 [Methanosarcina mazei Go1]
MIISSKKRGWKFKADSYLIHSFIHPVVTSFYFLSFFIWHESALKYFHFLGMLFEEYHVCFLSFFLRKHLQKGYQAS